MAINPTDLSEIFSLVSMLWITGWTELNGKPFITENISGIKKQNKKQKVEQECNICRKYHDDYSKCLKL